MLQDTEPTCPGSVLKPESDQSLGSPKVSGLFVFLFFEVGTVNELCCTVLESTTGPD